MMGLLKNHKEKKMREEALKLRNSVFGVDVKTDNEGRPENMKETIDAWLDKKHWLTKTSLDGNQIKALTLLINLGNQYKVKCIKALTKTFCMLKLSEGRKSSDELVKILSSNRQEVIEESNLRKTINAFTR